MSDYCDGPKASAPVDLNVEDNLHNRRIVAIVEKHRAELEAAGVNAIRLDSRERERNSFVADDPKIKVDLDKGGEWRIGNPFTVVHGYAPDGTPVNNVTGHLVPNTISIVSIEPLGGNAENSNSVMEAIAKDLKKAGLGDFQEVATDRCGGPAQLVKETVVKTSKAR